MQKYGIDPTLQNSDGDSFVWTGGGYAKVDKVDDHAGIGDYIKAAVITGVSVALGNVAGAASGFGGIASGAIKGAVGSAAGGVLSGNGLSFADVATGALTGGLMGSFGELAKASTVDQLETLEGLSDLYEGAGMTDSYQMVREAIDAINNGSDFVDATSGMSDLIVGAQQVVDMVKDDIPDVTWDEETIGTINSDILGDTAFS